MSATVISIYMSNVGKDIVDRQYQCVNRLLPKGWTFIQQLTDRSHPEALGLSLSLLKDQIVVFLDIDCIPLSKRAFEYLYYHATRGFLTGAIQRANHISNHSHLYIGPFCMAFDYEKYKNLGSPSFKETYRGDVGEELTYRWQENNQPLCFLYPSHVDAPKWCITDSIKFGYGTTYQGMFYHTFCIRDQAQHKKFIEKCDFVLSEELGYVYQ